MRQPTDMTQNRTVPLADQLDICAAASADEMNAGWGMKLEPKDTIEGCSAALIRQLVEALEKAAEIIKEHVPEDALGEVGGICPEPGQPDMVGSGKDYELWYINNTLQLAYQGSETDD